MDLLLSKIAEKIKKDPLAVGPYEDYYAIARGRGGPLDLVDLSEMISKVMPEMARADVGKARDLMYLHRNVLRLAAPDNFDSYLQFVEWNREPRKKFYMPRRAVLKQVVDALQDLADDKLDMLGISLPPGTGKLLADDTPVFTADGWKKHGDLCVGDRVVGMDGRYKRVLHVFPKDMAEYEVTFANGEKILCHGNHEWYVYNRHRQKYEIMETEAMYRSQMSTGEDGRRGHRYMYLLPYTEAMLGEEQALPVDPYIFGAWLGDGTTNKPAMTICDTDCRIVYEVVKRGYPLHRVYTQVGCKRYEFDGLRKDLQKLGLCQCSDATPKYIPEVYLRASLAQRLQLLAGIIDTDGTKSREGRYAISTTSGQLKDGICALVSTFGWRYTLVTHDPKESTSGIQGKRSVHVIMFNPTIIIPCKIQRKRVMRAATKRMVSISGIRKVNPVPGNCIQVEDGIYRVGRTMLPTHNSTLSIFYLTWLAGKYPDSPILTGSHSNSWVRGAYDECLRIFDPQGEYLWGEVFPGVQVSNTNAKDCRIDLGSRKRFETLEFTSIGTGNAGLYRAATLLYCDDLVSGIEVAMSKDRLDKLWDTYTTDLRQRKIGDRCKELHIATRWSVHDVVGRLEDEYSGNPKAKFIALSAMNEKDESNFDYPYGVGFSTAFYREQREIMDDVNWRALYMNQPIEREGLLYAPDELQRYFELPEEEPDAIVAVCDTKDRGSDDAVMPIAYVYGDRWYIDEIVCSNANPEIVDVLLIDALVRHKVKMARFESNSAGGRVAQTVQQGVKERGGVTKVETKYTTKNKDTRILVSSPWVKEHCLFKDDTVSDRDYKRAVSKLCAYTTAGKNKHDDVPDAFAQLSEYAESFGTAVVKIFQRPF